MLDFVDLRKMFFCEKTVKEAEKINWKLRLGLEVLEYIMKLQVLTENRKHSNWNMGKRYEHTFHQEDTQMANKHIKRYLMSSMKGI